MMPRVGGAVHCSGPFLTQTCNSSVHKNVLRWSWLRIRDSIEQALPRDYAARISGGVTKDVADPGPVEVQPSRTARLYGQDRIASLK